jgi:hypothetical protein
MHFPSRRIREAPPASWARTGADRAGGGVSTGADSRVPRAPSTYSTLADSEDQKYPGCGRLITYGMAACRTWPAMHTDAYDGPWNRSRTTILVISALHDPGHPDLGCEDRGQ